VAIAWAKQAELMLKKIS